MDLSLSNNSANKVAANDAKPASSSRAEAKSASQPKGREFSTFLDNKSTQPTKTDNTPAEPRTKSVGDRQEANMAPSENALAPQESTQQRPVAMDQATGTLPRTVNVPTQEEQQPTLTASGQVVPGVDPMLVQAQTNAAAVTGSAPVKLQAMLDFIFKSEGLADKAPVLASLKAQAKTSMLDLSTMKDNPFFQQLENSASPEEFMQQALPVGELLNQLQVSPTIMMALNSAGFDLRAKVTPEQLLNAVGITSERLVSALNITPNPKGINDLPLPKGVVDPKLASVATSTETNRTPVGTQQDMPEASVEAPRMPQQVPDQSMPTTTPRAKTVAVDPYEQLASQQSGETVKVTFADNGEVQTSETSSYSLSALAAQADAGDLTPVSMNQQATPTANVTPFKGDTMDALLRTQFSSEEIKVEPEQNPDLNITEQPARFNGATVLGESTPQKVSSTQNSELNLAVQKMPISTLAEAWENNQEDFMNHGEEGPALEHDDQARVDTKIPEFSLAENFQQHAAPGLEKVVEAPVKEPVDHAQFAEKVKEIFDKAEMLVKDGGGSMKIDMSSEELGKLDLAVDVQGDKVDLRIIASSEKVKEILTQDIPKLRDALDSQNLQLKNVEISQQSTSGWNLNQRSHERSFEQAMNKDSTRGQRNLDAVSAFASRPRAYANPAYHSGKIQVLV